MKTALVPYGDHILGCGKWEEKAIVNQFCFPIAQNDRINKHMKMTLAQFRTLNPKATQIPKYSRIS